MLFVLLNVVYLCGKGEKDKMLLYMEQKYGEPFQVMEPYAGQLGKEYTMIRVRSMNKNKEGILVRASGKERQVYQDNYLAYLLKSEIEQRLKETADSVFGSCKVFYKIPELVFPEEFPADMDVDAFLKHPQSKVRIYIYVKRYPDHVQEQIDCFFERIKQKGYVIGGVISYPLEEEMYRMITEENFKGDIYQGYQSRTEAVFSMDEKGELMYLEWKGEHPDE